MIFRMRRIAKGSGKASRTEFVVRRQGQEQAVFRSFAAVGRYLTELAGAVRRAAAKTIADLEADRDDQETERNNAYIFIEMQKTEIAELKNTLANAKVVASINKARWGQLVKLVRELKARNDDMADKIQDLEARATQNRRYLS